MKISLNQIRFYQGAYKWSDDVTAIGAAKLAEKVGAQLGAIEEVIEIGKKYEGIIIAKVVACEKHPNADKLSLCKVDDGGKAQNVERDENGRVEVVCGAPNVREGLMAAWLPPGSTVPSTYDKDPLVLETREIRGIKSNGMLASAKELAISDDHSGILAIDGEVAPGTDFAQEYNLKNDVILDIENKMFTHRPDCFGFMGVARELAGIQQMPFKSPDWYKREPELPTLETDQLPLEVKIDLPKDNLVPRFCAITMRGVKVGMSPIWLQVELSKVGLRPINNIVDLTNYYMILTGQPLHAYDYDKVAARSGDTPTILVRYPKEGEKLKLLNGKEIQPRAEAIMIATDKELIGVGGVMGGADTEVDENTRNIIIECANFNMYSIRRTAMEHGLFTDAVTRFSKGQSPLQNPAVLSKIVADVKRLASGKVASGLIDVINSDRITVGAGDDWAGMKVEVTPEFINERLGLHLGQEEIIKLLENVEFGHDVDGESITFYPPFWRTDIEIPEDIVEEVGRLYGFDHLPLDLPRRSITPAPKDALLEGKQKIREALAKAGANEVLTYSFVHGNLLDKVGRDKSQAFRVANALSPDLQYYRLSLTPSLLEKVHPNIKAGYDKFAIFELGKVHDTASTGEDGLPLGMERVALVYAASDKASKADASAPYYQARMYATNLLHSLGIQDFTIEEYDLDISNNPTAACRVAPFVSGRRGMIIASAYGAEKVVAGIIGEFTPSVLKNFKLPDYSAGFELDLQVLVELQRKSIALKYIPLPRFPKVTQDITFKVPASVSYQDLRDLISGELKNKKPENSLAELSPLNIFQREEDKEHKQTSFRVNIVSYERTLTDAEVNKILDSIAGVAKGKIGAERI